MALTMPPVSASRHRLSLEHLPMRQAKASLNEVEAPWKARVGEAIGRAFQLAALSQKEAAGLMGRDPAQVARWTSGAETPQLAALFAVEALRAPLVIALARLTEGCDVTTHISISLRRSA